MEKYPHQLSGGMLQRIMIGIAASMQPALLIADEPTTAIDAITQFEILDELLRIKRQHQTAMVFISHDLTSITYLCDDVLFLYKGHVTEYLPVNRICEVKDDYARRLLESIVVFDTEEEMAG